MERPKLIRVDEEEAEPYSCEYNDTCNKQATHYRHVDGDRQWLCHDHVTEIRNKFFKSKA